MLFCSFPRLGTCARILTPFMLVAGVGCDTLRDLTGSKPNESSEHAPNPGSHGHIAAQGINASQVKLTWDLASDRKTPQAELRYDVYYRAARTIDRHAIDSGAARIAVSSTANIAEATINNLAANTSYQFDVAVTDGDGNQRFYQSTLAATLPLTFRVIGNLADLEPASESSSCPEGALAWHDVIVYAGFDAEFGCELWIAQAPSYIGTMVADLCPGPCGSRPAQFTLSGEHVYFSADDGELGAELWTLPLATLIPRVVRDIYTGPDGSAPSHLAALGNRIQFVADDGEHGRELWQSEGSEAGTVLLAELVPGATGGDPRRITSIGDRTFFTPHSGGQPWRSDGTAAGTSQLAVIHPTGDTLADFYTAWGDDVVFSAANPASGYEPWILPAAATAPRRLFDVRSGPPGSAPFGYHVLNGKLVFVADDGHRGSELWMAKDRENPPTMIADIVLGPTGSAPAPQVVLNQQLLFTATLAETGRELWATDGTEAGTRILADIYPLAPGSQPRSFYVWGEVAYFTANHPDSGHELWVTDGTPSGTNIALDLAAGTSSSDLTVVGKVNDGMIGIGSVNGSRQLLLLPLP